jgi:CheY-like chemotaxis protein
MFPRNIVVVNRIADSLPFIQGNATQINQILINLCVNARDAVIQANKTYKAITIVANEVELKDFCPSMSKSVISGKFLSIEVQDTGTGIDQDLTDKIFNPYFTTKNAELGTGLGLSTSLAIASNHGGYIDVMSQKDIGSTFRLLLPVVPAKVESPAEDLPRNPLGKGETILLVEDEQVFQEILKLMLRSYNYDVITASNGAEALGIYYEPPKKIDLVLMAMVMPIMSGVELIPKLRQKKPDVKIICMTGTDSRSDDLSMLQPNAALSKPCNTSQLLMTIRNVLEDKPK